MDDECDELIIEWWEERAAIIEYEGDRGRENAEKLAAICVRREFGRVPAVVMEVVKKGN